VKCANFYILLSLTVGLLSSCEESNPETVFVADASVAFSFINQRALSSVIEEVEIKTIENKKTQDSLDAINLRLKLLSDSLTKIQAEINAGNTALEAHLALVISKMSADTIERINYTIQLGDLVSQINGLTRKKTIIESGKVKIDTVLILFGLTNISYKDSLTSYRFPLNIESEISSYLITLAATDFQLDLLHDNNIVVDARRRARVIPENFRTLSTSFDSIKFNCNPCNAGITTVICYF